jgi:hypothetical protein
VMDLEIRGCDVFETLLYVDEGCESRVVRGM